MIDATADVFLSNSEFHEFIKRHKEKLGNRGLSEDEIKKRMLIFKKVETILSNFPDESPKVESPLIDDHIFYSEVYDTFNGDAKKAISIYIQATTGQLKRSLFLLSGAGKDEEISQATHSKRGAEVTVNRVYRSSLAFNIKYRLEITAYKLSKGFYAVVNEVIEDYGRELEKEGKKWHGKPYHKVEQDMNIDFYKQLPTEFKFVSLNLFEGDIKSRSTALNTTKDIGNLLTFNLLDNKLHKKMKEEARISWAKRKEAFQKLILASK
jgi:hypothetical protein